MIPSYLAEDFRRSVQNGALERDLERIQVNGFASYAYIEDINQARDVIDSLCRIVTVLMIKNLKDIADTKELVRSLG